MIKKFIFLSLCFLFVISSVNFTYAKEKDSDSSNVIQKKMEKEKINAKNKLERIRKNKNVVIKKESGTTFTFIPSKKVKDKEAYEAEIKDLCAQGSGTSRLFTPRVEPYSGSIIDLLFDDTVDWSNNGLMLNDTATMSGTSEGYWRGLTPYNAYSLEYIDTATFKARNISGITYSFPGALWSGISGKDVNLEIDSDIIYNNWAYNLDYSGYYISCYDLGLYARNQATKWKLYSSSSKKIVNSYNHTGWW